MRTSDRPLNTKHVVDFIQSSLYVVIVVSLCREQKRRREITCDDERPVENDDGRHRRLLRSVRMNPPMTNVP